ncbi:MAG: PKD domain-containing protein [Candidatus Alcyoniella australis]|nr:PKD domain-containing protein [Candidatus Alcyoniella australis]
MDFRRSTVLCALLLMLVTCCACCSGQADGVEDSSTQRPDPGVSDGNLECGMRRVFDLRIGESVQVEFQGRDPIEIELLQVQSEFDDKRGALRRSLVQVAVNGTALWIESGNYTLPISINGVQLDCPVTADYYANSNEDRWGLQRDARLRVWRDGCPLFCADDFYYPLPQQRWMENRTQAGNEPTDDYLPFMRSIYYHSGVDLGGVEALDTVAAATAGLVVLAHGEVLPGYEQTPAQLEQHMGRDRIDVVYLLDDRGWFYRYSHLYGAFPEVRIGEQVVAGQPIGLLGKEGSSGGWSHLHFEIICEQPSGLWGTEAAYAYLWEAYLEQHDPRLIAVARPHRYGVPGDLIELDGSRSRSMAGQIVEYRWHFHDGQIASGQRVSRVYDQPGFFTELLQVRDDQGNTAFDPAVVQIVHRNHLPLYSYLHAAHYPSQQVRAGESVVFKARLIGIGGGSEVWDFGDGSPLANTESDSSPVGGYAQIEHSYDAAGDYLVRVQRVNKRGEPSIVRLWVRVKP